MNKINYGLSNCYIAKMGAGGIYAAPFSVVGAKSLQLTANVAVEQANFNTDNGKVSAPIKNTDNGYTGELNTATLPLQFMTDILGYTIDDNGVLCCGNHPFVRFAILFETKTDGDVVRHLYTGCTCEKPDFVANTVAETAQVDAKALKITIAPTYAKGQVNYKSITKSANQTVFDNWFNAVYGG